MHIILRAKFIIYHIDDSNAPQISQTFVSIWIKHRSDVKELDQRVINIGLIEMTTYQFRMIIMTTNDYEYIKHSKLDWNAV